MLPPKAIYETLSQLDFAHWEPLAISVDSRFRGNDIVGGLGIFRISLFDQNVEKKQLLRVTLREYSIRYVQSRAQ